MIKLYALLYVLFHKHLKLTYAPTIDIYQYIIYYTINCQPPAPDLCHINVIGCARKYLYVNKFGWRHCDAKFGGFRWHTPARTIDVQKQWAARSYAKDTLQPRYETCWCENENRIIDTYSKCQHCIWVAASAAYNTNCSYWIAPRKYQTHNAEHPGLRGLLLSFHF